MISVKKAFENEKRDMGLQDRDARLMDYAIIRDKKNGANSLLLVTYEYDNKPIKGVSQMSTRRFALYQGDKEFAKVSGIVDTSLDK